VNPVCQRTTVGARLQSKPISDKPRRHAVCRQALRLHFRRERFGRSHRRAVGQAVRLRGEYRIWIGVRLSGDSRRSMVVWKEESVERTIRRERATQGARRHPN
jgi:hypothetical protein